MRLTILALVLLLVYVTLNYIIKCLEYKDLRDLFDNRGKSIKMLNNDLEKLKKRFDIAIKINAQLDEENDNLLRTSQIQFAEIIRLKHRVYVLKKDTKRNQRAIVRYKAQNAKFKHTCSELGEQLSEMTTKWILTDMQKTCYKAWCDRDNKERDAYLYCLRQIQEEVENAKEE